MSKRNKKIIIAVVTFLLVVGIGFSSIFKSAAKEDKNKEPSTKSEEIAKDDNNKLKIDLEEDSEEDTSKDESELKEEDINKDKDGDKNIDKNKDEDKGKDQDSSNKNTESNDSNNTNPGNTNSSNGNSNTTIDDKNNTATKPQEPKKQTVTISISCKTAINNGVNQEPGFTYLPASGVILSQKTVEITEGETVFDVLQRTVRTNGIQMQYTGSGSSIYVEGIHNLYEFDGGKDSGWMYCVNGWYPNYGAGAYKLKANDIIQWNYTCDLGRDLGR